MAGVPERGFKQDSNLPTLRPTGKKRRASCCSDSAGVSAAPAGGKL